MLTRLILIPLISDRCNYYSHFTDEATEAQRVLVNFQASKRQSWNLNPSNMAPECVSTSHNPAYSLLIAVNTAPSPIPGMRLHMYLLKNE